MTRSKSFTALALAILLIAPLLSFSSTPANVGRPTAQTRVQGISHAEGTKYIHHLHNQEAAENPHILAASYYRLTVDMEATLTLNNKAPHPTETQLTLFGLTGARLDAGPIMVERNSFRVINLRDYVGADSAFQEGSLQVLYHGKNLQLGAQVRLVDAEHSLIFDEQLVEPAKMFASARLASVWWLPSHSCNISLALSNTTDASVSVTARVDGIAPKQRRPLTIVLNPFETRVMDVKRDLIGNRGGTLLQLGGISLQHSGWPGALLARAMIQEPATGYSASVQFFDPQTAKSSKLNGAGLRLSRVGGERLTPVVAAYNAGSTETVVSGRIPYTASDGRTGFIALPSLRLAPGEVNIVNLSGALSKSRLGQTVVSAGLEFKYTSAPGSVVMSAQSTSASGRQVFRVPLIDAESMPSSTGGYPWSIDDDSSTIIYIKNCSSIRQHYFLQLNFDGDVYAPGLKTVEAGQTAVLDVRALRDSQVADAFGRVIPLSATRGQVTWSIDGPHDLALIGRAEQIDVVHGLSSSYACASCCPYYFSDAWCDPGNVTGLPGDTTQFQAWEQREDCYGNLFAPILRTATWSSTDSAVATVDSSGLATAQSLGSTHIQASWTTYTYAERPDGLGCTYGLYHAIAEALCDVVQLRISVPNPAVPTENSESYSSIVAGEGFSMVIQAVNLAGQVVCKDFTLTVVASRSLASTEVGLPSTVTLTCGSTSRGMRLNRVNNQQLGTTYRFRLSGDPNGAHVDFSLYTYFRVYSTREGLVGGTTGCGHVIQANDHFVALPVSGLCGQKVMVRNPNTVQLDATKKLDAGPHFPGGQCDPGGTTGDPYWNTGTRPRVESLTCETGNNNSGIDLADGTFATVGSPSQVIWRFD
jgi:hypothetical protein